MARSVRRLIGIYFAVAATPLLIGFSLLLAYDPLQLFHLSWGRPQTFHSNFRLQTAGIVRHQSFDSVILGTSMTENTSANEAGRLFGGNFANLSWTAGDFYERALLMDYLFRHKAVKEVIFTVDHIYINTRKGYSLYPLATFDYLYDRNPLNDIRAYLNRHFAECLWHWSKAPECVGSATDLDRPNRWFAQTEYAARFGGLQKWCDARDNYQIRDAKSLLRKALDDRAAGVDQSPSAEQVDRRTRAAIQYVDENVLRLVRAHPETHFRLFFPPYFRATYAIWQQARPLHWAIHRAVVRHLADASAQLPNLDVHGFEDAAFADDLANYKDLGHYNESIDSQILLEISAGRHRLTRSNVETYLQLATEKARTFDLADLARKLDACSKPL